MRKWFEASFDAPTPAQAGGWPAISSGASTLICAPTGSGKTLAAFLWGIDRLATEPQRGDGTRIVYVSPLKALSYDIERNLRAPLAGIGAEISVGLRTGDTPQKERQAMRRNPPDILITTPESLYLILSSGAREMLGSVEAVIVDEIHAVAQSKRGSHLALTLERLEQLVQREDEEATLQRIGLSATQRPLERIASFLVGPKRQCEVIDAGRSKKLDLEIQVPVEDMTEPGASASAAGGAEKPSEAPSNAGGAGASDFSATGPATERIDPGPIEASLDPATNARSIWPAIYPELLRLVREHTSTIIFVNSRRGAERLAKRLNELANEEEPQELPATEHGGHAQVSAAGGAEKPSEAPSNTGGAGASDFSATGPAAQDGDVARAHHGSLSHEERSLVEELLKSGKLPCLVATSSLELGIDMGALDLVIQVESPKSVTRGLQRIGRAGHGLGEVSKGRIFPKFRADLLECAVVAKRMRSGEIEETVIPQNPLDVLAQHLVSMAALDEWEVDEVERLVTSAQPFAELSREQLENVLDMLDGRYPSERFAELRPRIVWDRTAGTIRGRKGSRQLVVTNAGTIPDRGLYGVHLPDGRRVGELDEEMVYEARPGQ
ncbi:MAG TPA: DEAD/DEAH box helicase, partial [Solirubrobacterales bacterium]